MFQRRFASSSHNPIVQAFINFSTAIAHIWTAEQTFDEGITIAAAKSLWMDGKSNTRLIETSADVLKIEVGNQNGIILEEDNTECNIVCGADNALATNAVNGFLYIPTQAGAPTGTPSPTYTGKVPMTYDTTNDALLLFNSTWQRLGPITQTHGVSGNNAYAIADTGEFCSFSQPALNPTEQIREIPVLVTATFCRATWNIAGNNYAAASTNTLVLRDNSSDVTAITITIPDDSTNGAFSVEAVVAIAKEAPCAMEFNTDSATGDCIHRGFSIMFEER